MSQLNENQIAVKYYERGSRATNLKYFVTNRINGNQSSGVCYMVLPLTGLIRTYAMYYFNS